MILTWKREKRTTEGTAYRDAKEYCVYTSEAGLVFPGMRFGEPNPGEWRFSPKWDAKDTYAGETLADAKESAQKIWRTHLRVQNPAQLALDAVAYFAPHKEQPRYSNTYDALPRLALHAALSQMTEAGISPDEKLAAVLIEMCKVRMLPEASK